MDGLSLLRNHMEDVYNLTLSDFQLERLLEVAAECIIIIDHSECESEMRAAYDEGGGCSVCGDLSGFECVCEDDEDEWTCECKECGKESERLINNLCPECAHELFF